MQVNNDLHGYNLLHRTNSAVADWEKPRLDSWLKRLEEGGLVVTYVADTERGWFYVAREDSDDDIIRK